jgi:hypothetical protein
VRIFIQKTVYITINQYIMSISKINDFVKAKKISEHLTGEPLRVRQTSKKFQGILRQCNDAVASILNGSVLNEEQEAISRAVTPIYTEKQVIELINSQNINELEKLESLAKMELEAFEMLRHYFKCRKEAYELVREKAAEHEGYARVEFEMDIFKISAVCDVTHTFVKGDHVTPDNHDIDVEINIFEMKTL